MKRRMEEFEKKFLNHKIKESLIESNQQIMNQNLKETGSSSKLILVILSLNSILIIILIVDNLYERRTRKAYENMRLNNIGHELI